MSERPKLRVVRGNPTPEETAALVAVLTARAAPARPAAPASHPRTAWSDPARQMRRPLPHGPGAWRSFRTSV